MRKYFILIIFIIIVGFFAMILALSGNDSGGFTGTSSSVEPMLMMVTGTPAVQLVSNDTSSQGNGEAQVRIVLQNANLRIVADDPRQKADEITQMAVELGGWVVNSTVQTSTNFDDSISTTANVTIRVPADDLLVALERVKTDVISVASESVIGQDVTQDYTIL